jgi:hypothetical protein
MRNLAGLAAAALLTGCAAHQATPPRIISTDWATVEALGQGTKVTLIVGDDYIRRGDIIGVSAAAITLRERTGVRMVSRADIWRVTVREPAGTRRWSRVVKGAAAGAAITAVPAYLAWGIDENGANRAGTIQLFLLGPAIGAAIGSMQAPEQVFRERIVYVRP